MNPPAAMKTSPAAILATDAAGLLAELRRR
jgi:hypothetical protein